MIATSPLAQSCFLPFPPRVIPGACSPRNLLHTDLCPQVCFLRQAQEIDIIHSHSIDVGIEALGAKVAGLNEELYV